MVTKKRKKTSKVNAAKKTGSFLPESLAVPRFIPELAISELERPKPSGETLVASDGFKADRKTRIKRFREAHDLTIQKGKEL